MEVKILSVDDSKTIRLIISRAFKKYNCKILEACNGVEGLAVASREKPDVIILDITMPVMDGYEALAKIKADPDLKKIPVVMLTAEAGRDNVTRIAKMGVRDYLVKPFKEDLVVERISRIVDLQPKGQKAEKKKFDDPLNVNVIDDKPAIVDIVKGSVADTPWNIEGITKIGDTVDICTKKTPDLVLVSLSLDGNSGFDMFTALRTNPQTKHIPIFGLCVKIANEEQARAVEMGFDAVITKPINPDDLKGKVMRALKLDDSHLYFEHKEGVLQVKFPSEFSPAVASRIQAHLRPKLTDAVDSGLNMVVVDLSKFATADFDAIKTAISVVEMVEEVGLTYRVAASEAISKEASGIEETNGWAFSGSFEDAVAELKGAVVAA